MSQLPPLPCFIDGAAVLTDKRFPDINPSTGKIIRDVCEAGASEVDRAVAALLRAGRGAIVHVASPVGRIGANKVSYAASKAALLGLSAAEARNLAPEVRVNAVLPGPTSTKMTSDWDAAKREQVARGTLLGRMCEPEEIAGVVAFLLGADATCVTGAVLNATGGANIGL